MSDVLLCGAGRGAPGGVSSATALPGTAANDAAVGSVAWVSPSSALADDGATADATLTFGVQSQYLKLTNFGFSIPAGATVVGIVVSLDLVNSSGLFSGTILRLVVGGSVSGNDYGSSVDWITLDEVGGAADNWGLSLTGADVNASNFGIVLSTIGNSGRGSAVARVDYASITVYYS